MDARNEAGNALLVAQAAKDGRALWYAGSGWDRSGAFPDVAAWDRTVDAFAARVRSPLRLEVLAR